MKIKAKILQKIKDNETQYNLVLNKIMTRSTCSYQTATRWYNNNTRELLIYSNLLVILITYEIIIKKKNLSFEDIIEREQKDYL